MPIVRVVVSDDDTGSTKLEGATVYFYNTTGVFQTSGVTDSDGIATVTLPDASYDIYIYLQSFALIQPQRIVIDSLLENSFSVTGHLRTLPEPMDTNLCRVSGFLVDVSVQPIRYVDLVFSQKVMNIVVTNFLGYNIPFTIKSDKNGYFEFDLIRGLKYDVSYEMFDSYLEVKVAEIPAVHLHSLLFPIPAAITLSATTLTATAGHPNTTITYDIIFTDYNHDVAPGNRWSSVKAVSSNPSVASAEFTDGTLTVAPSSSGTATITFTRMFDPNYYWRNIPAFVSPSLVVTVT